MAKQFNICGEVGVSGITRTISPMQNVAIGSSGTLVTLTPPQGQYVLLSFLGSSVAFEAGITINISSNSIASSIPLGIINGTSFNFGSVIIGNYSSASTQSIRGGINETITIVKDTGTTVNTLYYAYSFLE